MKRVPAELLAHLQTGATTLCYCWKITRNDGRVLGFTDHDRAVEFGALTFEASSGFAASAITQELGFKVSTSDIAGALQSQALKEDDLVNGLYDNAAIELWLVNWTSPAQRLLLRRGSIGEIKREDHAFKAEMRGLMHELDQEQGRLFQHGCDADLGDRRCRFNLNDHQYKATGTVIEASDRASFTAEGLDAFASDWFTQGLVTWISGDNRNASVEVKFHHRRPPTYIDLWQPMGATLRRGDRFTITAGCDKTFATCKNKFRNAANFRGFPHIPGNDFALSVGKAGR